MQTCTKEWLKVEGFELVSELINAEKGMSLVTYDLCATAISSNNDPGVYLFVREADNQLSVIYVGIAGKGWPARRAQHNAGYRRANKGLSAPAHHGRIEQLNLLLYQPGNIWIYEKKTNDFNEEEIYLISAFDPIFNVKHRKKVNKPAPLV